MALLVRLADTLANTCDTLGNIKGKALNNLLAGTPPEKMSKILGDTMGECKGHISNRHAD